MYYKLYEKIIEFTKKIIFFLMALLLGSGLEVEFMTHFFIFSGCYWRISFWIPAHY
jgi:hypothetical protein